MKKFDKAKIGDKVWSVTLGHGIIKEIGSKKYLMKVNFGYTEYWYLLDGRRREEDRFPDLYWNEFRIPDEKEDTKQFDLSNPNCKLEEFLDYYLQPKEFTLNTNNWYIARYGTTYQASTIEVTDYITVYFETVPDKVLEELNKHKITPQQLKDAYKKLGWL